MCDFNTKCYWLHVHLSATTLIRSKLEKALTIYKSQSLWGKVNAGRQ